MKVTIRVYPRIFVLAIIIFSTLHGVKTVYIPRSQGHAPSMVCMPAYEYTVINTLNYGTSYKNHLIAQDLFGTSKITLSGSAVPNRGACDILADNLGLAPDFESTITFKPSISNLVYAFYFNEPLDKVLSGLYVNFMLPVAYTVWGLNPCERVINRGSTPFANGYMGDTLVTFTAASPLPVYSGASSCSCDCITPAPSPAAPAQTASSAQQYFQGQVITGDILRPLSYNKISWCPLKRTELAELIVRLGRNLICSERAYTSVFIRASFPTGNKPRPEYLFAPIAGNGKFFELGLGTQGQCRCTSLDNPTNVTFLWDISGETLFENKQWRTFDLLNANGCNQSPLSRYLLLKNISSSGNYNGELIEASYVTTFPVFVSRPFQGDIDLKLAIEHKCFTQTFGYALWGTTAEHLRPLCDQPTCPTGGNFYGIKGTSGAYNYITSGTLATGLAPLNATESSSTIYAAGALDNPVAVPNSTPYYNVTGTTVIDPTLAAYASQPPVLIEFGNMDINSARSPAQMTHAFFAETGYNWQLHHTTGNLLFGASVETASHAPAELHQWSVWIKGTVAW